MGGKRERDIGRCGMRMWKMEVRGHRKIWITKTEVGQYYTKIHEGDTSTERRSTRPKNMGNETFILEWPKLVWTPALGVYL